jgi:hypothetical protein
MSFSYRPPAGSGSALLDSMAAHGWLPRGLRKLATEESVSIPLPGRLAQLKALFVRLIGGSEKKPTAKKKDKKEADIIKGRRAERETS